MSANGVAVIWAKRRDWPLAAGEGKAHPPQPQSDTADAMVMPRNSSVHLREGGGGADGYCTLPTFPEFGNACLNFELQEGPPPAIMMAGLKIPLQYDIMMVKVLGASLHH